MNEAKVKHLAIIMDGNSRWAKKQKLTTELGHYHGYQSAFNVVKNSIANNIEELTLFVLSQENIKNRSSFEINCLEKILVQAIKDRADELIENKVSLNFIGDYSVFSPKVQLAIKNIMVKTTCNAKMKLNLALNYSGRWHISECVKHFVQNKSADVDDKLINDWFGKELSDCDLLIRTGNESRLSNFLLWHLSYSELYFSSRLWPDFSNEDFSQALKWFTLRKRRFGGRN